MTCIFNLASTLHYFYLVVLFHRGEPAWEHLPTYLQPSILWSTTVCPAASTTHTVTGLNPCSLQQPIAACVIPAA
jgi:hypothetical protein